MTGANNNGWRKADDHEGLPISGPDGIYPVLVVFVRDRMRSVHTGYYLGGNVGKWRLDGTCSDWSDYITHWQPLPALPDLPRSKNVAKETWTTDEVKKLFWRTFHESGEWFFDYIGNEESNEQSTAQNWDCWVEQMEQFESDPDSPKVDA